MSKADQKKLDALEAEYETLEYDGSDEAAAEIARIEEAVAALQGDPVFDGADVARAGAVVSLAHNGEPRVERGFIRPEDDSRPEKAARAKTVGGQTPLSEKLVTELTAYKTMALREALGSNPDAALTAVTHALALSACFRGAAELSCLQVSGRSPSLSSLLPSIEDSAPAQRVAARHETWAKALPDDPAALWDYLTDQAMEARLSLLAHCAAFTVDAIQRPVQSEERVRHADQLARDVDLDMAASWTPTAANYLGRVSKERILEAVRESPPNMRAVHPLEEPVRALALVLSMSVELRPFDEPIAGGAQARHVFHAIGQILTNGAEQRDRLFLWRPVVEREDIEGVSQNGDAVEPVRRVPLGERDLLSDQRHKSHEPIERAIARRAD